MLKKILIFLDRYYWVWLALAAPFLLFPSPGRSPVMLVVPGLFLLRWLAIRESNPAASQPVQSSGDNRRSVIPFTPLNGVLVLMLFMVLVSLWATFDINYSLSKISGIVLGVGIFFAFVRAGQTVRGWWTFFLLFLAFGFGIAAIGLLGTHWVSKVAFLNPIVSRLAPRLTGAPGVEDGFNQNSVAGALLWVIPSFCAFSGLLLKMAKDLRGLIGGWKTTTVLVLTLGATLWVIAILLLTQSRESYLSLGLVLVAILLIALPPRWRKRSLAALAVIAIIVGSLIGLRWGAVSTWLSGADTTTGTALSLDSFRVRLEVWSAAINGIKDFPFTGMGMNAFRKVMMTFYPISIVSVDMGHAHNEFLQAALDLGIPGLIAFAATYIIAFWMLVRTWRGVGKSGPQKPRLQNMPVTSNKPGDWFLKAVSLLLTDGRLVRAAILGLGGGLLAHMLWGMTDAMALGARPAFVLWMILGLTCGLHQQNHDLAAQADTGMLNIDSTIGPNK